MHPYQATPFGALPEEETRVSPPPVQAPQPKLGALLNPLPPARKPELPSFQIHLGETRN